MMSNSQILFQIKTGIQEIIPDAEVFLFGSRARGDWNNESDWDILVLTEKKYPKAIKWQIHDKLFPLSVSVGAVFQFIIATKDEWEQKPEYYTLHLGVRDELTAL